MTDTPDKIKKLQLSIWLAKTPEERLDQFMIENEALYQFWDSAKAALKAAQQMVITGSDTNKR